MAIETDSRVYKYRIRFEYEKHGDASRGKTHTLTRFSVARGPGQGSLIREVEHRSAKHSSAGAPTAGLHTSVVAVGFGGPASGAAART